MATNQENDNPKQHSDKIDFEYVSALYGENRDSVYSYLTRRCSAGAIHNTSHMEIFRLIEKELGLPIPI